MKVGICMVLGFGVWDEISAAQQQSAGYLVTYYYCIVIKEGKCGLAETD